MVPIETLCSHSIEDFIPRSMLESMKSECLTSFAASEAISLHCVEGLTTSEAESIFSPFGRSTIVCSAKLGEILTSCFYRQLPAIKGVYQAVTKPSDWYLVKYEEGQYISPHVDLPDRLTDGSVKYAALVCTIVNRMTGGEFYLETSAASSEWHVNGPAWKDEPTMNNADFRTRKTTKWICAPSEGTAVLFGCRTIHGTEPVKSGFVVKAMTFLYGEP